MKPTHSVIQPCTWLDETVFATKDGALGMFIRLHPRDSECMDQAEMETAVRRFDAAIRLTSSDCVVYQYLTKRCVKGISGPRARAVYLEAKDLYLFEVRLVVLMLDPYSMQRLKTLAASICIQLGDIIPAEIEDKDQAYLFLRTLLNYDPSVASAARLKYDHFMDYYAADSEIEAHRDFLRVGDYFVRVLTLKDPPATTFPDVFRVLREIPCECIIVSEWKPMDQHEARALVTKTTTHFHRSKIVNSIGGALIDAIGKVFGAGGAQKERLEDMQKDEGAMAMETQMGALARDIEENGTILGDYALTIIVFDLDPAKVIQSVAHACKAATSADALLYRESFNALSGWFACIPGGQQHQHRKMRLTNRNHADMAIVFAPSSGDPLNGHLKSDCLTVMETRQSTPYYGNLHYQDVGHALFSGQTGSGKSFLANHLLSSARERYGARVTIFDIGGSYKDLTRQFGGSYMEIGLKHDFTINPFSLRECEENRHFLFSFVKVLIESGEHRMGDVEQDELYQAIPGVKQLSELVPKLSSALRPYLARWVGTGQYGALFDNPHDTLTCSTFQTFEFEGLERYPQILEPLLFYILHRSNADIYDTASRGTFKIFLLDEAWRFLMNPTVKLYIHESLKTWRKKNAAMWLATQSIDDLDQSEMLRTVAENCGSLVLLPNPRMDRERYRQVFKLNERELDLVASMQPKKESLWKPAVGESKVVILDLGRN